MGDDRGMNDAPVDVAVVTGASSGIGAATARRLAAEGFHVVAAARRTDRLERLAEEIRAAGGAVTTAESVAALAAKVSELPAALTLLVNNAGGAIGLEPLEEADIAEYRQMYEVNVLGTVRVTQALLPALERSGRGTIVVMSSTAALAPYEGGGGYCAAKHAESAIAGTLRLELCGRP